MITIYHVPNSRSIRIVWLMEEMGEDYKIKKVTIPFPNDFLELSPLQTIPTIVDDDADEPIVLCESLAILQYLTGRRLVAGDKVATGLTTGPLPSPAAYAEHLQWLHFGEADLAGPLGAIFRTQIFAPDGEKENATTKDQHDQLAKRLAILEDHMSDGRKWVTGERFTIADISIGYLFTFANYMKLDLGLGSHVAAYRDRLLARPALQRTMEK